MRQLLILLGLLLWCALMSAQVPIAGTFSSLPPQSAIVVSGPALSPPILDLGNGLTPPVVLNKTYVVVPTYANTEVQPSTVGLPQGAEMPPVGRLGQLRFDFVVAGGEPAYGSKAAQTRSLGEIARERRGTKSQAGRLYTNEDIDRVKQQ
ncbi:MAG TPA: hypothetical protein VN622_02230 [Clostridia bacterium]|nr:hypothetical protein [Clostridia bacterium]